MQHLATWDVLQRLRKTLNVWTFVGQQYCSLDIVSSELLIVSPTQVSKFWLDMGLYFIVFSWVLNFGLFWNICGTQTINTT